MSFFSKVHPFILCASYIPSIIKTPLYWFPQPLIQHTTLL